MLFGAWGKEQGLVSEDEDQRTRVVLDRMENIVRTDLSKLDEILKGLRERHGLEIFDIGKEMLERSSALSFEKLGLGPFDQANLSFDPGSRRTIALRGRQRSCVL
jgi:hypothetical protein